MKKDLLHTFAIPAYKKPEYINECINSLKNQTVRSDIILTTSTPSDYLETIAERHKIRLAVNPIQEGIASDWSFACNASSTKYVTLAHQDDIYLPHYTDKCLETAETTADNLITFTDYNELYNGNIRSNTPLLAIKRLILSPFFSLNNSTSFKLFKKSILATGSAICCPSVMFNRETIGPIHFNKHLSINMDWDFWLRMADREGSFSFVDDILMTHRIHESSETTVGLSNNIRQTEDLIMFRKIWPKAISDILSRFYSLAYISNG